MKNFFSCFALALLATTIPPAYADTMSDDLTIEINGTAVTGVSVLHHNFFSTTASAISAICTGILLPALFPSQAALASWQPDFSA